MEKTLIKFCQRRWRVRLLAGSYTKFTETAPAVQVRAVCRLCGQHTAQALTSSLAEGLALKDWCFFEEKYAKALAGTDIRFADWFAPLKKGYEDEAAKIWRKMPTLQLSDTVDKIIEKEIEAW